MPSLLKLRHWWDTKMGKKLGPEDQAIEWMNKGRELTVKELNLEIRKVEALERIARSLEAMSIPARVNQIADILTEEDRNSPDDIEPKVPKPKIKIVSPGFENTKMTEEVIIASMTEPKPDTSGKFNWWNIKGGGKVRHCENCKLFLRYNKDKGNNGSYEHGKFDFDKKIFYFVADTCDNWGG